MKSVLIKSFILFAVICCSNLLTYAQETFRSDYGCDPVSRYGKVLADETRWIIILSGEESGHSGIKSVIIRERFREEYCNGQLQTFRELTYRCECQRLDGVLYIVDGYYRLIRVQGSRHYICPKNPGCQGHSYTYREEYYVTAQRGTVVYPDVSCVVWDKRRQY